MVEFKEVEKEEKNNLKKRIKRIEQAFEQRFIDLKKAIEKERKNGKISI